MKRYLILLSLCFFLACILQTKRKIKEAERYIKKGEYRSAILILENLEEKNSKVNYLLGVSYLNVNQFEPAHKYFTKSVNIDSTYADSIIKNYSDLTDRYLKMRMDDMAAHTFERILEIKDNYDIGENFYLLGDYYYDHKKFLKAKEYYIKGLESVSSGKSSKDAKIKVVKSLLELGELTESLEWCEKFLEEETTEDLLWHKGEIAYKLAEKKYKEKNYGESLVYASKVIEAGSPIHLLDNVNFLLGEINFSLKNYIKAKKFYRNVLKLNPYRRGMLVSEAKRRLKQIKSIEGK